MLIITYIAANQSGCAFKITIIIKKILSIFAISLTFVSMTMAQNITGCIISNTDGSPVISAIIQERDADNYVSTDMSGNFSISVNKSGATIICSCIGYDILEIAIDGNNNLGVIRMNESALYLKDAIISSQVAVSRRTPIAATTLSRIEIDERIGSQEFVEVLKYTPGVHANRQGGGWCDSEIFMRGFDNTNIAVNINGVNMNDVENGSVYWSNWAGISDVVSILQTQRGIGASKVSSPSVGSTINNSTYWRFDRLYYSSDTGRSGNYNYLGGTAKAGFNYNINQYNNVFVNVGWLTKAPQFKNGVFMSVNTSNVINKEVKNEQSVSIDLGYGFHNRYVSFNASVYYTEWLDKTMTKKGKMTNKTQYYMNMIGVNARHMGIEFDAKFTPAHWVDINTMVSLGHWTWDSDNVKGHAYDIHGNALTPSEETTTPGAADHAWAIINMKGVKVGGSVQTTAAIETIFKTTHNFRIGSGYNL